MTQPLPLLPARALPGVRCPARGLQRALRRLHRSRLLRVPARRPAAPTDAFDGTFESQTVRQVIEWKAPARFDDVLEVSVRTSRLGTTSFTLDFELRRAGEAELLVTSETVYVHVDPETWHQARDRARACAPPSKPAPPARPSITRAICADRHPGSRRGE